MYVGTMILLEVIARFGFGRTPRSTAAAATVSHELPETDTAAAVCLYVHFSLLTLVGSILT
jgi:hypothetical protein